ncbi:SURF1 family protein [Pseudarthrobacter sp. NamE2]|uniref:SURF1 family protein n=1 Tax=Pseudarthrobacter sp. NamE2 TaxID=2576838 RepID=UPI0010FE717C|nr:SURF1 family protein [Pseudarthrobacter sp. NamE2]TLM85516.1 SURF1 family protein [Pseudarthrobacter sp. NamE2]
MWKTALKPRWIAGFIFAIAVSGVFVLLSQWQFGRSTQPEQPVNPATEQVQPLTETLQPGEFFHGTDADQMVRATGTYDAGKQVLVPGRLHNGKTGYWVVTAFAVEGAPTLAGAAASPQTWIPVARGWVAEPGDAAAPLSGPIELTGRLLPSEAPLPNTAAKPGEATAVSVAELINYWEVSSYPGFVAATTELAGGVDVSPAAVPGELLPLRIGPQPPAQQINWLNLFYSLEWVVFAGFALFIWWRLVKDDYHRDLEDSLDEDDAPAPAGLEPKPQHPEQTQQKVQP